MEQLQFPLGAHSPSDAMRKQLGLQMEKETTAVGVIVIDHIEAKPTPN